MNLQGPLQSLFVRIVQSTSSRTTSVFSSGGTIPTRTIAITALKFAANIGCNRRGSFRIPFGSLDLGRFEVVDNTGK
jgi:hypothetical protein